MRPAIVLRTGAILLVASVLFQGAIGYAQYFTGLPPLLVGLHMLGAAILLATATNLADLALAPRQPLRQRIQSA